MGGWKGGRRATRGHFKGRQTNARLVCTDLWVLKWKDVIEKQHDEMSAGGGGGGSVGSDTTQTEVI